MDFNWYLTAILLYFIMIGIMDIILRKKKVDENNIRVFESLTICIGIVYLLLTSQNTGLIALLGTTLVSLAWVFKSVLENLGSTLLLHMLPQYKQHDVINVGTGGATMTNLRFEGVGLLRTKLIRDNGDILYVPNSNLMNDYVQILTKKAK